VTEKEAARMYRCASGHAISEEELDSQTEIRSLDQGAVVRICRAHGAPISVQLEPKTATGESDI
jgi:hypothetical protein